MTEFNPMCSLRICLHMCLIATKFHGSRIPPYNVCGMVTWCYDFSTLDVKHDDSNDSREHLWSTCTRGCFLVTIGRTQAELREASQEDQEQNKGQHWLKRCLSQKGKSVFIAVTTMLGYILLYLAISAIAPFYPIWVSLSTKTVLVSWIWRSDSSYKISQWRLTDTLAFTTQCDVHAL